MKALKPKYKVLADSILCQFAAQVNESPVDVVLDRSLILPKDFPLERKQKVTDSGDVKIKITLTKKHKKMIKALVRSHCPGKRYAKAVKNAVRATIILAALEKNK